MTSAQLFAEAVDTLFVVFHALLAWIAVGAFVLTVCLFTGIAVIARGVKGARRALDGPCGGLGAAGGSPVLPDAPEAVSARTGPRTPSWARTDTDTPTDIGEAA